MNLVQAAAERMNDEMSFAYRDTEDGRNVIFMAEDFACELPEEGPAVDEFRGNRDYYALMNAAEKGDLHQVELDEVDMEALREQLEATRDEFAREDLDMDKFHEDEMEMDVERTSRFDEEPVLEDDFEMAL